MILYIGGTGTPGTCVRQSGHSVWSCVEISGRWGVMDSSVCVVLCNERRCTNVGWDATARDNMVVMGWDRGCELGSVCVCVCVCARARTRWLGQASLASSPPNQPFSLFPQTKKLHPSASCTHLPPGRVKVRDHSFGPSGSSVLLCPHLGPRPRSKL